MKNTLRFLIVGFVALFSAQLLLADVSVGTLNAYMLFSPENHESTGLKREGYSRDDYAKKIRNLSALVSGVGVDFVALQEIGSDVEAADLAMALRTDTGGEWQVCFVQGKDTYTGQDVAAVVRKRPGLRVIDARRDAALDRLLSKHVVVRLVADGKEYDVLVVHLIRPIGASAEKHAGQVSAISKWIASRATGRSQPVVAGDFNDSNQSLLPYPAANVLVGWQPTHLAGKAFDHIYSTQQAVSASVVRPPYAKKPSDAQKQAWTDHYFLWAIYK